MVVATLVTKAHRCAAIWHAGQLRKGAPTQPCINHLTEVAELIAATAGGWDVNLIAAAVLHDAIEDVGITHQLLVGEFNRDIADLVLEVSDDKSLPKAERKWSHAGMVLTLSPRARLLKLAEVTCNLRAIRESPAVDWSPQQRRGYLEWAKTVAIGAEGSNAALDAAFIDAAVALQKVLAESDLWTVFVNDNFHYMDPDECWKLASFDSYHEAVAACQKLVDDFLDKQAIETAEALFEYYVAFGDDPWIAGPDVNPKQVKFSAWDYARQRCAELRP